MCLSFDSLLRVNSKTLPHKQSADAGLGRLFIDYMFDLSKYAYHCFLSLGPDSFHIKVHPAFAYMYFVLHLYSIRYQVCHHITQCPGPIDFHSDEIHHIIVELSCLCCSCYTIDSMLKASISFNMVSCFAAGCNHTNESHHCKFYRFPSEETHKSSYAKWIALSR